jgi:hypothetical protein
VNSLRSNSTVFLTKKPLIFFTLFSLGGKKAFDEHFQKNKHWWPEKQAGKDD